MDTKIADLETKRDGAGKYARIFEAQIQGFRQCTVNWEAPAEPIIDVSNFERKPETGYSNTDTKADQTDDSYSDDSSGVTITKETYTDDNSKLVTFEDTDNYAEDASADIVEDKLDTSAPY